MFGISCHSGGRGKDAHLERARKNDHSRRISRKTFRILQNEPKNGVEKYKTVSPGSFSIKSKKYKLTHEQNM